MITILFPSDTNWFYQRFATDLAVDLRQIGIIGNTVGSAQLTGQDTPAETLLVIAFAEVLFDCQRRGEEQSLRRWVSRCARRVLVNLDSIETVWFERHLEEGHNLFDEVYDYGMVDQLGGDEILGLPVSWVPEALTSKAIAALQDSRGTRTLKWAIVGHETPDRAAFAAAAVQTLPCGGIVYMPPLRPFSSAYGLDEAAIRRLLSSCDFYVWGSHHKHRYHECLRATDAVSVGAIPVKIDPLYAADMDLPWVYGSLEEFRASEAFENPLAGYEQARNRILANKTMGANFALALQQAQEQSDG